MTREDAVAMAELLGMQGGLRRRLGDAGGAVESYRLGAAVELAHGLDTTYNRVNHVKHALLAARTPLLDLLPEIEVLAGSLDRRLRARGRASDGAWLWADLGDVRALLGDAWGAASAYLVFIAQAQTDPPRTAMSVVEALWAALRGWDEASRRAREALDASRRTLAGAGR